MAEINNKVFGTGCLGNTSQACRRQCQSTNAFGRHYLSTYCLPEVNRHWKAAYSLGKETITFKILCPGLQGEYARKLSEDTGQSAIGWESRGSFLEGLLKMSKGWDRSAVATRRHLGCTFQGEKKGAVDGESQCLKNPAKDCSLP